MHAPLRERLRGEIDQHRERLAGHEALVLAIPLKKSSHPIESARLKAILHRDVERIDATIWPRALALPLTVGEALVMVQKHVDGMVSTLAEEIDIAARALVDPKLVEAVLTRALLPAHWPWIAPGRQGPLQPAWVALELLQPRPLVLHALQPVEPAVAGLKGYWWPPEVAPRDVALWLQAALWRWAKRCPADEAGRLRAHADRLPQQVQETATFSGLGWCPRVGAALLHQTEREVLDGLRRPAVAIDASQAHHHLLTGWRDMPKDHTTPGAIWQAGDRVELLPPHTAGSGVQLALPMAGESTLHEATIFAMRRLRDWEGLRHWAALLRQFSVEGGRQGWVRWTMQQHLDALGYAQRVREDPARLAQIAEQVELLTQLELVVYDRSGQERSRRPLLHIGERFERLEKSCWRLDGMQLQINPLLYAGVRDIETGKLGRDWFPAPVELAQLDHNKRPYAIALGLVLPVRWRWRMADDSDHLPLNGRTLLALGGIPYQGRRAAAAWQKLTANLQTLQEIDLLADWQWDGGGPALEATCRLSPGRWITDRTRFRLKPVESPPLDIPRTGKELKAWRKASPRSWSQREAARQLGVGQATVSRAEAKPQQQLSPSLRAAFDQLKVG
jgi:hypothetical protein